MLTRFRIIERKEATELQIDEVVFSGGGGFLFGTVAGYAIKKVMKIAAVVVGLFVAGLAYLSYKGSEKRISVSIYDVLNKNSFQEDKINELIPRIIDLAKRSL
ncbi:MAG: FUN14 domain-containing protein [Thermoproteota archaeon]|nr:FUN14 domain-containing protein [Thermoproteota archaeon]